MLVPMVVPPRRIGMHNTGLISISKFAFFFMVCVSFSDINSAKNCMHDSLGSRRNLFIIQDDYNEFWGCLGACTVALLRALQAESAPILVSSSLWMNMCIYLRLHGDEHFLKPKKKRWRIYYVNSAVYLAVPQQYINQVRQICSACEIDESVADWPSGLNLTPDDLIVGLKCSSLQELYAPFACTLPRLGFYGLRMIMTVAHVEADITQHVLQKALITRLDVSSLEQYPGYEIFLLGHGRASRILRDYIAGFTVNEFRSFLNCLATDFNVNVLIYQTCYGGGRHLVVPYMTSHKPDRYTYPIVSCSSGSIPSSVIYDPFSEHNLDFSKIFKNVADGSTSLDLHQRLAAFYPHNSDSLKKRVLHNLPLIREAEQPNL